MKSPASLRSDRVATFPGLGGRFHRNTHLAEPLPGSGPERLSATAVRVRVLQGEAANDANRSDSGNHREIVTIHLIFQRAFSHLVEAVKIQCRPSPVRVDQPMETDGQALLVLPLNCRRGSDHPRSTRD